AGGGRRWAILSSGATGFAMPDARILCVYCKEDAPRPARGEHIILEGLGARATIPDVCAHCNSKLGRNPDREFLRQSFVALRRFLDPAYTSGETGDTQFFPVEW